VLLVASLVAAVLASASGSTAVAATPAVGHVWIIELENKGYNQTFGPGSPAPYLASTLTTQGQLLTQYYGIGHVSLDNYVAEVSGQAPNAATQSDCIFYADFAPPVGVFAPGDQAIGQGCVYPSNVPTVANQLDAALKTWKGYMQDMGSPCVHPALNSQDKTQSATPQSQYAARHNPFVYFHSIIDNPAYCNDHVVDLSALSNDLGSLATTPNFSFITPDLCNDGHDATCADGGPGGLPAADAFLQAWVPSITASPAFQQDGLLIVMFDEADVSTNFDGTACCGEQPGPNSPMPGIGGPGGGRTGAVLLSPFVTAGSVNDTPFNHYSLLRSIEDVFSLSHLGYAGADGLQAFGDDHDTVPVYH
jgi:hypothetical protein